MKSLLRLLVLLAVLLVPAERMAGSPPPAAPVVKYSAVARFPHDTSAFTQGLLFRDGLFYESTGLNGRSRLRVVEPLSGRVQREISLPREYFGEGIAIAGDRILQLTWTSRRGFIYDLADFQKLGEFRYPTEGWGMTGDTRVLIMSDGTDRLQLLDPRTLRKRSELRVSDGGKPIARLNELERVGDELLSNVWQTDLIARIDLATGHVIEWLDLSGLLTPEERAQAAEMNGIAWDEAGGRLLVTGKFWPWVFEIRPETAIIAPEKL